MNSLADLKAQRLNAYKPVEVFDVRENLGFGFQSEKGEPVVSLVE